MWANDTSPALLLHKLPAHYSNAIHLGRRGRDKEEAKEMEFGGNKMHGGAAYEAEMSTGRKAVGTKRWRGCTTGNETREKLEIKKV